MGKAPVNSIIQQSSTGHATNIIAGLSVGMKSTVIPILVLAGGIMASYHFAGLYGVAIAAAGMMAVAAASPVKAANKPIEPLTSKERYSRPVHSAIFKNIINSDRTPKELSDTLFKKGPVRTKHNGVQVIAKQDIEDGNKIHLHHPITGEHTGTITRPS